MSERARPLVRYSKRERAHVYYGTGPTGGMLSYFFEGIRYPDNKTLVEELAARGYDVTTLRLTCRRTALRKGE